jgi:hypothetical protein
MNFAKKKGHPSSILWVVTSTKYGLDVFDARMAVKETKFSGKLTR